LKNASSLEREHLTVAKPSQLHKVGPGVANLFGVRPNKFGKSFKGSFSNLLFSINGLKGISKRFQEQNKWLWAMR
jgi:hypothetical protein